MTFPAMTCLYSYVHTGLGVSKRVSIGENRVDFGELIVGRLLSLMYFLKLVM